MKEDQEKDEIKKNEIDTDVVVDNKDNIEEDGIVIGTAQENIEEIILNEDDVEVTEETKEIATEPVVEPDTVKEPVAEPEPTPTVTTPPEEKPKQSKKWFLSVGIALIILLAIYILTNINNREAVDPIETESEPAIVETESEETTETTETVEPTEKEPEEEPEETEIEEVEDIEEIEDIEEVDKNALDETITNKTWIGIDKALKAITEYKDNPTIANRLVSNGGYLYNVNIDDNVDYSRILVQDEIPELNIHQSHILYIYSDDLKRYPNLRINDNKQLEIFYAYKTQEGYAISSNNSGGGILSQENFDDLINKYTAKHSNITKPNKNDADFMELEFMSLVAMLKETKGSDTMVDTRFLQLDDDYAVIVTSLKSSPQDVNAFLFEKIYDEWTLVSENFNKKENYYVALNNEFPLLNMNLLPNYDIDQFNMATYETNLTPIVNGMIASNQITDADLPLTYGNGVNGCYYMEFESGKAFVGIVDSDGTLIAYPVSNTNEITAVLNEHVNRPPYIIFKQY